MFDHLFDHFKTELTSWIQSGTEQWIAGLQEQLQGPEPGGELELIYHFGIFDHPLNQGGMSIDEDAWRIESYDDGRERRAGQAAGGRLVHLFEIPEPNLTEGVLVCRAQIKTLDLLEPAKLELIHSRKADLFGISGSFKTSRAASFVGTTPWQTHEFRYHFKKEQTHPEQPAGRIQVDLDFHSSGVVWLKHLELFQAQVKSPR